MPGQGDVATIAALDVEAKAAQDPPFTEVAEEKAGFSQDVEVEAAEGESVMDMIKQLRDAGLSFEKIAQQLDEDSVPTPSGRGRWRGQTVSKLLKE